MLLFVKINVNFLKYRYKIDITIFPIYAIIISIIVFYENSPAYDADDVIEMKGCGGISWENEFSRFFYCFPVF